MSMPQRATNRDRVQDQRSSVLESLEPRVLLSVSAWPMLGHDALGSRVLADASTTQVGNSAPISIFNSGFGYTSVLTGDVNADGLPEAVLRRNDRIDIIGGDGAVQTSFPVDGVRLDMLADLDGDGQMDIFVSDNAGDGTLRIRVFDDTGDLLGQFTKPTPTANATMYAQSLVDLNLDGKLELVAALNGWMTNFRGVAVFDAATGVELAASEVGPIVQSVCVANVSGDSKLEIVAGSVGVCNSVTGLDGSVDSASYVWAWDATATAQWRSGPLNSGGYYDSAVMPADLNQDQDGQMDLVVTASSHGESLWTATVGRIGLLDPTTHAMISGSIRDFGGPVEVQAVADLQPGGTQEVLVVHEDRASQTFFLRELSGSDGFADLYTHGFGGQRPTVQAVNDLNGDGKDEILVSAGTTLYCLRRDLTVLWQWSRPNDPTRPEQPILSAIVTDMTEDGINDVLVTSGNSEANSRVDLLSLTPDLAWGEPGFDLANDRFVPQASASSDGNAYAVAQTEEGYSTVFTGDVNADGKVEIVLGNGTDVVILLAGRGQLAQGQTGAQGSLEGDVQLTGVGALDLVQDVTGDGVPEVIVSDRLGSAVRLRAYDGAGNLVRTFTMAATGDSTITAQGVADLNQDDTLELVASVDSSGVSGQRGVVVFDALTGAQIGYYDVGPSVQAVSIGSVGGDSKMEIVFAGRGQASGRTGADGSSDSSAYVWWLNAQGGSLWRAGPLDSGMARDSYVLLSDVNGDGTLETVTSSFIRDGQGLWPAADGFVVVLDSNLVSQGRSRWFDGPTQVVAAADLDGDGQKELLVIQQDHTNQTYVLRVLDATIGLPDVAGLEVGGDAPTVFAINDLDGDGENEILAAVGDTLFVLASDLTVLWQRSLPTGDSPVVSAIVSDVDGDGINEILAVTSVSGSYQVDVLRPVMNTGPDLVVQAGAESFPAIMSPDDEGSVSIILANQGGAAASGFDAEVHLSANAIWGDEDDILLWMTTDGSTLIPGMSMTRTVDFAIPSDLPSGDYHVACMIDSSETTAEDVETNNIWWSEQTVFVAATVDAYENDNLPGLATTIAVDGTPQTHTLDTAADLDWTKFTLASMSEALITSDCRFGGDTTITLYGPDSSSHVVGTSSGSNGLSMLSFTGAELLLPGVYYLRVSSATGGPVTAYELSVTASGATVPGDDNEPNDDAANATPIDANSTSTGSLPTGDEDWFAFTLADNADVFLSVDGTSGGDTQMWLTGSDGLSILAYSDNEGTGLYSQIYQALPAGDYRIRLTARNDIPGYVLSVISAENIVPADSYEPDDDSVSATPIEPDAPQSHSLHTADDVDWLTFQLDGYAGVHLTTWGDEGGGTSVWLYGPDSDGTLLDSYTGGAYAGLSTGVLAPGQYYVKIASGNAQELDQYGVELNLLDAYESDNTYDIANSIGTDGTAQSHAISADGDQDWATFILSEVSNATINTAGDAGDTVLRLYGPNDPGLLVDWNDDDSDGLFSTIEASNLLPGQYWVQVTSYSATADVPQYWLSVNADLADLGDNPVSLVGQADGTVVATFGRPISLGGFDPARDIYVVNDATGGRIAGTVRWYSGNTVMVWQPNQRPGGAQVWDILLDGVDSGGFLDVYGLPLDASGSELTWDLTGADMTPPQVASVTGQPNGMVIVRFSEAMDTTLIAGNPDAIRVTDEDGIPVAGTFQWTSGNQTLTWQPTAAPDQVQTWRVTLWANEAEGFADTAGNALDGDGNAIAGGDFSATWQVYSPPHVLAFKGDVGGSVLIDFDQVMDPSSVRNGAELNVRDAAGQIVPGALAWANNDQRLTWQPTQAPTSSGTWTITLASGTASGFQDLVGFGLDGDDDGVAGGNYTQTWSVSPPAAAPLRVRDFASSPDGTAIFTFNRRVLTSQVTADDVEVLDGSGQRVSGSIVWSEGGLVMTWTPDSPPEAAEEWTITLAGQSIYDFVDYAYNGLSEDANGTPGDVTRSFTVAPAGDPSNPPYVDLYESNDAPADAATIDMSAGPRTVGNLTIDHAGDEDWFSFATSQTGTAKDQAFLRTNVGSLGQFGLDLTLYAADGTTQLATTAGSADTAQETISLNGRAAGHYYLKVSGAVNPNYSLTVQTTEPTAPTWTVLYYLAGDNDLDEAYYDEVDRMERLDLPSNVTVAVQFDRAPGIRPEWQGDILEDWSNTRRGILARNSQAGQIGTWLTVADPAQPELDMGSAQTLADFIIWAVQSQPADHYVLNLVDHGDAVRGIAWDVSNRQSYLDLARIHSALAQAYAATGEQFDIVLMDTCLSDMAEVATVVAPYGRYMVASEELSYTGFLHKELKRFESNIDSPVSEIATDLAWVAVQSNVGAKSISGRTLPATQAVIDLSEIDALNAAIEGFVDTCVAQATGAVWSQLVVEASQTTHFYNPTSRDLGKFMERVAVNTTLPTAIRDAAQAVRVALDAAVVVNCAENDLADGLAVTLPLVLSIPYAAMATEFVAATGWDQFLTHVSSAASSLTFPDDWSEPNNQRTQAYNLQPLQGQIDLTGLSLTTGADEDYFRLQLLEDGDADSYIQGNSSVTLELYTTAWVKLNQPWDAATGRLSLNGVPAGIYQLRVASKNGLSGMYPLTMSLPMAEDDWAGENHDRDSAVCVTLVPATTTPLVGLTLDNTQDDWFYVPLSNLTNGAGGYVELQGDDTTTMEVYAAGSDTPLATTHGRYDIPAGTEGNLYFKVLSDSDVPVSYALSVKGPAYESSGVVLLHQWSLPGGAAHVAVFGSPSLSAADFSGVKVVFGKADAIKSITLSSLPAGAIGIGVWGATSVAKVADTRRVPTDLTFLAFTCPVTTVTLKSGLSGQMLNGFSLGGLNLPGNLDGDADTSDATALYLGAGSGATVTIAGDVTADIDAVAGLKSLTVNGRASSGNITLGGGLAAKVKLAHALNESLDSSVAIASVTAGDWLHTGAGSDHIGAPSVGTMTVTGNLDTGLVLSGVGVAINKPTLASLKVTGQVGGTWNITGNVSALTAGSTSSAMVATVTGTITTISLGTLRGTLTAGHIKTLAVKQSVIDATVTANPAAAAGLGIAKMTVTSWVTNSTIRSGGLLGSVTLGGLVDSTLVAGSATLSNASRPVLTDVNGMSPAATIAALTLKGVKGTAYALKNSVVAADAIKSLNVINADTTAGTLRSSVLADLINVFTYKSAAGKVTRKPMATNADDWSGDTLDVRLV